MRSRQKTYGEFRRPIRNLREPGMTSPLTRRKHAPIFLAATVGKRGLLAVLSFLLGVTAPGSHSAGAVGEPTKVVRVGPRDKSTDVDVQAPLQVHFSNGLKLTSLTAEAVRLLDSEG